MTWKLKAAFWGGWLLLGAFGMGMLFLSSEVSAQPTTETRATTETAEQVSIFTSGQAPTEEVEVAVETENAPAPASSELQMPALAANTSSPTGAGPQDMDAALKSLRQDLGTAEKEEADAKAKAEGEDQTVRDKPVGQQTIAVVRDGPSPLFDAKLKLVKAELAELIPDSTRYAFLEKPAFNGSWNQAQGKKALQAALDDPNVDMVLTFGLITTSIAAQKDFKLKKPVLSASMQTTDLFGVEVNREGQSTKENYSFILLPDGLDTDLKTFHDMMRFKRVAIIVDADTYQALSGAAKRVEEKMSKLPFRVSFIPASGSPESIAARAKATSPRGVVVAGLPQMSLTEQDQLIKALNNRRVATFSLGGRSDVERGMLAALFPESGDIIARRIALNINQIMLGMSTQDLPVYIALQQQLVINARTANQIGYSPSFSILMVANVLYGEELDQGRPLTIDEAMRMAAVTNVDLVVARGQTNLSEALKNIDRSFLLPQVFSNLTYTHVDGETNRLSQGTTPESLLTTGISVRQVIFSDELISNFLAARNRFRAEQLQYQSVRLDVMALAAARFINLLAAESLLRIEVDNLKLTQTNLQIARIRFEVGDTGPADVLRWESEEAQGRAEVFLRESDVGVALTELNQALGVPGNRRWDAQDIVLGDEDMYFLDNGLQDYVTNPDQLERFREYSVFLALRNSPSLKAIDERVDARKIQLAQTERQFFIPEITGAFDLDQVIEADTINNVANSDVIVDTPWQAQVIASLPLFEGGKRFSEVYANRSELDIIIGNRITAGQFIDQGTRTAIYNIEGSYPNIELSRRSREAAEENLDLVRKQYQEGAVSIIDLIDAQNQAFGEQQRASQAVYTYLGDLYDYQRQISWYELGKTPAQKKAWLKNVSEGMQQVRKIKAVTNSTGTRAAAQAQGAKVETGPKVEGPSAP